jgi:hypothetical protein
MRKCTQSLKSTYDLSSLSDFLPFSLIKRPNPLVPFHLRVQVVFAPALYCIGHGGLKADEPRGLRHQHGQRSFMSASRTLHHQMSAPPLRFSFCLFCIPNHGDLLQIFHLHTRHKLRQCATPCLTPITLSNITTYSRIRVTNGHHRYGIAGLKVLARQKFSHDLDLHLDSPDFPEACQEAYESTFHTDRGLRDVIIQAFRANPGLSLRKDVEMAVRETPGLAFELFRMASGMPITS